MLPIKTDNKHTIRDACIGLVVAGALAAFAPSEPFSGTKSMAAMTPHATAIKAPKSCQ